MKWKGWNAEYVELVTLLTKHNKRLTWGRHIHPNILVVGGGGWSPLGASTDPKYHNVVIATISESKSLERSVFTVTNPKKRFRRGGWTVWRNGPPLPPTHSPTRRLSPQIARQPHTAYLPQSSLHRYYAIHPLDTNAVLFITHISRESLRTDFIYLLVLSSIFTF